MNTAEQREFFIQLGRAYGDRMLDVDMHTLTNALKRHALADVMHALGQYRGTLQGHYRPTADSLIPFLPNVDQQKAIARKALTTYRTVTARVIIKSHPELLGLPESVILIRAYRAAFRRREKELQQLRGDQEALIDMSRAQLERELLAQLVGAGQSMIEARGLSLLVDADDEEFKQTIDALTNPRSVTA